MKKRSRIHPFEFSRRFVWLVFRFCLILPIGWFSTAQTLPVERITIKSAREGLSPSPPPPVELVIRRQSDGFYSNGEKINSGLVEALVNTFRQPPVANPKASNLGITQAWLNESVDLAGSKSFRYQLVLRAHVDAYRSFFMNLANVQKLLPSLFAGFHTDDYPHVEVQVVFVGGEIWLASSDSQYEFMIPWKVRARNADFTTYNADLSQRIAALMPDKSVNRERLSGESFKLRLAEAVMARIEADWLNPAITTLQTEYNVQRSEITSNSSVNYGREWKNGHPEEESALFVLRRDSLPKLFQDWLFLPFRNEKVYGASEFLQTAAKYESLVLSVPWLNDVRPIDLQFVQGRSLGEKAMNLFTTDMNERGKRDLANMVASAQKETALVLIQGAYCLVLPDKRVILWRFHNVPGSRVVLKWTRDLTSQAPNVPPIGL